MEAFVVTSTDWIQTLCLVPHPEGGYYREIHRSSKLIQRCALPSGYSGKRELGSVIYYMLTSNNNSAFHRLHSDEIWHFHDGSAFLIHLISPDGAYSVVRLGLDIFVGEVPCFVIPAGYYFGAEVAEENSFALATCTVIPAFSFDDFEMPSRDELISIFPHLTNEIIHLTGES
jgi:predicted cupin superfamily sugar epimerase